MKAWRVENPDAWREIAARSKGRGKEDDEYKRKSYTVISNPNREPWNFRVGARLSAEEVRAGRIYGTLDPGMILASGDERIMVEPDGRKQKLVKL